MGRPRVLIAKRTLVALYVDRGLSLRETARSLGVGHLTVRRRLETLGIAVREAVGAADLRRLTVTPAAPGGCRACGRTDGPLCRPCRREAAAAARRGRCAFRDCRENGLGGWCYAHRKRIEGLIA